MDSVLYRRATSDDIHSLVEMRAAFLAEVAGADAAEPNLIAALSRYFTENIASGDFIAFLATNGDRIIATSGLVYHRHPPSAKNLTGVEAYIMNMYTLPEWRGCGIAKTLMGKLIEVARESGCHRIRLHALPKAVSFYVRVGFVASNGGMHLDLF